MVQSDESRHIYSRPCLLSVAKIDYFLGDDEFWTSLISGAAHGYSDQLIGIVDGVEVRLDAEWRLQPNNGQLCLLLWLQFTATSEHRKWPCAIGEHHNHLDHQALMTGVAASPFRPRVSPYGVVLDDSNRWSHVSALAKNSPAAFGIRFDPDADPQPNEKGSVIAYGAILTLSQASSDLGIEMIADVDSHAA